MRVFRWTLCFALALAFGQTPQSVQFRHVRTFGSKYGVHPPRIWNTRGARAALGDGDNPYGIVSPTAVTTDLRHRVWIADSGTGSVHVFDTARGAYREIRRAAEIPLQQPSGLTSDSQGRVYLADAGNGGIFVFDENGEYDHALTRGARILQSPGAIALSADRRTIYVADPPRNAIVELNREGEIDGAIDLPPEFCEPSAISVVDNQIYVLGKRQHRVGIFSPGGRPRGEVRWEGIAIPTAFAFDPVRRRFFAANPRFTIVELRDEAGRALGNFGQLGDGVDQMHRVDALYVDTDGLIYVVDSLHGKVLVFAGFPQPA